MLHRLIRVSIHLACVGIIFIGFTITISCSSDDTVPPDTAITSSPDNPSNTSDANFVFECDEDTCTFECRMDSEEWDACTSPEAVTGMVDGAHIFSVRAIDGAGNIDENPAQFEWTIDTIPPDTTINTGPAHPILADEVVFEFESDEDGITFECRLNSAEWEPCTSPVSFSDLGYGNFTFEVRSVDHVGNADSDPAQWTWGFYPEVEKIASGVWHSCEILPEGTLYC